MHIVESIAIPPLPFVDTASQYNLNYEQQGVTSFLGAVYSAPSNLTLATTLNTTKDLTLFVPNNIAFETASGALTSLSPSALTTYLSYHAITALDSALYSANITNPNGTHYPTLQGTNLTLTFLNNAYFVNSARIVAPDVLLANGVMHIIDSVLSPETTTVTPDPTSATQIPVLPKTQSEFNSSAAPFTGYVADIVTTASSSDGAGGGAAATATTEVSGGAGGTASATSSGASATSSGSAKSAASGLVGKVGSWFHAFVAVSAGLVAVRICVW